MATEYAYLILMPATLLLASVNSMKLNHIDSYDCLLAMTWSNTLNIAVNHRGRNVSLLSDVLTFCSSMYL